MSRDTVTCSGCDHQYPAIENGMDNGLYLSGFLGYYGGFTDWREMHDNMAVLCHDCCVKLFETFPILAKNVGIEKHDGHHSSRDKSLPCCEYS
jgi:hypothetical protein